MDGKLMENLIVTDELIAAAGAWSRLESTHELLMGEPFDNAKKVSDEARGRILRAFMEGYAAALALRQTKN